MSMIGNLPPLPEPFSAFQLNDEWNCYEQITKEAWNRPDAVRAYTADQMREYAAQAVGSRRQELAPPESPWRTIDSAPKDGTWIVVMFDHYPDTVRWQWEGWDNGAGRMMNPKYWMPIPALPEVKP